MTAGNEHSPLLVEESEGAKRTPLRYALRFAAAAAAFAIVATVGVAAVHPNGSAVILRTSALGEDAPGPADPFADPGAADPGDAADAHALASASAVQNPTPAVSSASPGSEGIAGGYASIVSETKTKAATLAEESTYIETEGTKEELETNVRSLALADDRLKAASADTEKAEAILKQKELEESQARDEMERYQAAASNGGLSDRAQDIAKENTAALSADKRVYLNTRNTYSASTELVAKNKELLQQAKAASAAAMQAYVEKKADADANRAKAEEMANAMLSHNKETKAAAEVGEESTPDGISRSQTMAEISAAATQQDILANDIQTQASLLKQAWDNRLLEQKTAQETLDAEEARNAKLAQQSNKEQKDFIDSSHVAAIDATAAADAKKKADTDVLQASKRFAAAQTASEAARQELKRLANVETIRRQEFAAQTSKTDSIRAKTDVMEAIEEEAVIATQTEETKDATNRDAIINTISTDLANKDANAQANKAARDEASANAVANSISQAAIDEPVPTVVNQILQNSVITDEAVINSAEVLENMPSTPAIEEVEASSPEVAATGSSVAERAKEMAVAQQKAKEMAEAAKRSAAAARKETKA